MRSPVRASTPSAPRFRDGTPVVDVCSEDMSTISRIESSALKSTTDSGAIGDWNENSPPTAGSSSRKDECSLPHHLAEHPKKQLCLPSGLPSRAISITETPDSIFRLRVATGCTSSSPSAAALSRLQGIRHRALGEIQNSAGSAKLWRCRRAADRFPETSYEGSGHWSTPRSTNDRLTALRSITNPFDGIDGLDSLEQYTFSPSVFATVMSPSNVEDSEFRWSIDHMASLHPADIDEFPVHQQLLIRPNPEEEAKAQAAIDRFFSQPKFRLSSPWAEPCASMKGEPGLRADVAGSSGNEDDMPSVGKKIEHTVSCQTMLTFPPDLDLIQLLGPAFLHTDAEETNSSNSIVGENMSLSSLRRKLFSSDEDSRFEDRSFCADNPGESTRENLFNITESVVKPGESANESVFNTPELKRCDFSDQMSSSPVHFDMGTPPFRIGSHSTPRRPVVSPQLSPICASKDEPLQTPLGTLGRKRKERFRDSESMAVRPRKTVASNCRYLGTCSYGSASSETGQVQPFSKDQNDDDCSSQRVKSSSKVQEQSVAAKHACINPFAVCSGSGTLNFVPTTSGHKATDICLQEPHSDCSPVSTRSHSDLYRSPGPLLETFDTVSGSDIDISCVVDQTAQVPSECSVGHEHSFNILSIKSPSGTKPDDQPALLATGSKMAGNPAHVFQEDTGYGTFGSSLSALGTSSITGSNIYNDPGSIFRQDCSANDVVPLKTSTEASQVPFTAPNRDGHSIDPFLSFQPSSVNARTPVKLDSATVDVEKPTSQRVCGFVEARYRAGVNINLLCSNKEISDFDPKLASTPH